MNITDKFYTSSSAKEKANDDTTNINLSKESTLSLYLAPSTAEIEDKSNQAIDEKMNKLFSFLKKLNEERYQKNLRTLVTQCEKSNNISQTLSNITELDLSHCELETLPEEIAFLSKLKKLILLNNKLSGLPESLITLTNLRSIDLAVNHFKEVPAIVCQLGLKRIEEKKYFELFLCDNPMRIVPSKLRSVVRTMPHFGSVLK